MYTPHGRAVPYLQLTVIAINYKVYHWVIKMKKFEVRPGHEIRGMMIRLYPDAETKHKLDLIEADLRRCWNWLVKQTEEVLQARQAYAVKQGLVPPKPIRPVYEGMEPKESETAKDAYYEACKEWHQAVFKATNKVPCCAWRSTLKEEITRLGFVPTNGVQPKICNKYDYQFFSSDFFHHDPELRPCAHAYQALVKNYFSGKAADGKGRARGQRRKKFRRSFDPMPLQVRSGDCFKLGDFGRRGQNHKNTKDEAYYNCQIMFNSMKIRGRLPGIIPTGRILEGVSITKQADGWWASIKQEVPIRQIHEAVAGTIIGIDAGLDIIAAMSDGTKVDNPREKAYSERIAGRQSQGKPVGRLQQQAARHVRHLIYNKIVKPLALVETIKVEKLTGRIGQMGSRKTSSMRTMIQLLRDRYGNRVREVRCEYTSQDCSQCGHRSKDSWSYEHGRTGKCSVCGYHEDRDVNAARNIAARDLIPLDA